MDRWRQIRSKFFKNRLVEESLKTNFYLGLYHRQFLVYHQGYSQLLVELVIRILFIFDLFHKEFKTAHKV